MFSLIFGRFAVLLK